MRAPAWTRWWLRLTAAVMAVVGLAVAFVGIEFALAPRVGAVTPVAGTRLNANDIQIVISGSRLAARGSGVTVRLDGREVPRAQLSLDSRALSTSARLEDGPHRLEVEIRSHNLFARRITADAAFHVDTVPPQVELLEPLPATALPQRSTTVRLKLGEPVKDAVLLVDGRSTRLTVDGSQASGHVELDEGRHSLGLRVTDVAGNRTVREWQATADFSGPRLSLEDWPGEVWETMQDSLTFVTRDNMPDRVRLRVVLDGRKVEAEAGAGPGATATPVKQSASNTSGRYEQSFSIPITELAEGRHELGVSATDAGGHQATLTRTFVVDTADVLGGHDLVAGAVGRDVRELQRALARKGVYKQKPTSIFDDQTKEAVAAYKAGRGLPGSPHLVDQPTLASLLGSIRIDRANTRLYLYQEGKLVKTYRVAVGQTAYPTPRGSARIISKEVDPTWNPPDSPWAIGQDPVPPGPGNPLGTRWMGLSIPAIGIHGTYADGSIGRWASHGCIRMHIWDVEDLFERVFVGTPVTIF